MAHQHPRPLPAAPPPQAALPQVLVQVTPSGQLSVKSNLPSPGAWAQITAMLLAAAQTSHTEAMKEMQQSGAETPRIVVPNGVVMG